jgi:hypothetical protein
MNIDITRLNEYFRFTWLNWETIGNLHIPNPTKNSYDDATLNPPKQFVQQNIVIFKFKKLDKLRGRLGDEFHHILCADVTSAYRKKLK